MATIAKTRKPTKQQIALTKPVGKVIAIGQLDKEEIEYLLLLMASFKTYSDKAHNSYLKPARIPPISLGQANFFKLRYKLENVILPKELIDSI
jgi:hypothetical protein